MNILITICARGGSKGVPNKNILDIGGKPLIAYSIQTAQTFAKNHGAEIVLSTESEKIRGVAAKHGLESPYRRPESLAGDRVGKVAVIRDAWEWAEKHFEKSYELVLDLDVTSPLRTQKDLAEALEKIQRLKEAKVLYSVSHARRNPYFNMVEEADNDLVKLAKRPDKPFLSRQVAPKVYDINGSFYFYKREFFVEGFESVTLDHQSTVYVMTHLCFDIDEPLDYTFMKFLIEGGHLEIEV
ncbi:MAG: acylneuraminate cytidylyltransferase family protein [Bacteroidia bacterium]|nr:acylneuraminate cytidylyltransferase family protein [Bacteroidia bacterium]